MVVSRCIGMHSLLAFISIIINYVLLLLARDDDAHESNLFFSTYYDIMMFTLSPLYSCPCFFPLCCAIAYSTFLHIYHSIPIAHRGYPAPRRYRRPGR